MSEKSTLYRIVGEKVQERLAYLGRFTGDAAREIGSTTIDLIKKIRLIQRDHPNDFPDLTGIGAMQVYAWVAEITGMEVRTIRYYVMVVLFFPAEVWTEFDVLPFSHFAFAMTFGPKWRDILEVSEAQIKRNGGRPPSVAWLRANFSGISQVESAMEERDALNRMTDSQESPAENQVYEQGVLLGGVEVGVDYDEKKKIEFRLKRVWEALGPVGDYIHSMSAEIPDDVVSAYENLITKLYEYLSKIKSE